MKRRCKVRVETPQVLAVSSRLLLEVSQEMKRRECPILCVRGLGLQVVRESVVRLPSFSGHPICTDLVSVGEDVHCESTAQEVHAGVPA